MNEQYPVGDVSTTAKINNDLLQAGASYSISLTLTNFLDQSGIHSTVVKVATSNAIPRVKLLGVSNAVKYRWQQLNFFAEASVPDCAGAASRIPLEYD